MFLTLSLSFTSFPFCPSSLTFQTFAGISLKQLLSNSDLMDAFKTALIEAIAASLGIKGKYISITNIETAKAARRALAQLRLLEMQQALPSLDGLSSAFSVSSAKRQLALSVPRAPSSEDSLGLASSVPYYNLNHAKLQSDLRKSHLGNALSGKEDDADEEEEGGRVEDEEEASVLNDTDTESMGRRLYAVSQVNEIGVKLKVSAKANATTDSPSESAIDDDRDKDKAEPFAEHEDSSKLRRQLAEMQQMRQLITSNGVSVTYTITVVVENLDLPGVSNSDAQAAYASLVATLQAAVAVANITSGSQLNQLLDQIASTAGPYGSVIMKATASSSISVSDPIIIVLGTPLPTSAPTFSPTVYTEWFGSPQMGSIFVLGGIGTILILLWCVTYYVLPPLLGYKRRSNSVTSWRYFCSLEFWRKVDLNPLNLFRSKKPELKAHELLDGEHSLAYQTRLRKAEAAANHADPTRRKNQYLKSLQAAAQHAQGLAGRSGRHSIIEVPRRAADSFADDYDESHMIGNIYNPYNPYRGDGSLSSDDNSSSAESAFSGLSGFKSNSEGSVSLQGFENVSSKTGSSGELHRRTEGAGATQGTSSSSLFANVTTLGGLLPAIGIDNKVHSPGGQPGPGGAFSSDEESTRRSRGVFHPSGPATSAKMIAAKNALAAQARGRLSSLPDNSGDESEGNDSSSYSSLDGRPPLPLPPGAVSAAARRPPPPPSSGAGLLNSRRIRGPSPPPPSNWPQKSNRRDRNSANIDVKSNSSSSSGESDFSIAGFGSSDGSSQPSQIQRSSTLRRTLAESAFSDMDSSTGANSTGSKRRVSVAGGPARAPSPPRRQWPVKRSEAAAAAAGAGGLLGRLGIKGKEPAAPVSRQPSYGAQARRLDSRNPDEEFEL